MNGSPELLGAARVRELAARLGLRPTKQWGQNFVVDANTVRRIVRLAGVSLGPVRRTLHALEPAPAGRPHATPAPPRGRRPRRVADRTALDRHQHRPVHGRVSLRPRPAGARRTGPRRSARQQDRVDQDGRAVRANRTQWIEDTARARSEAWQQRHDRDATSARQHSSRDVPAAHAGPPSGSALNQPETRMFRHLCRTSNPQSFCTRKAQVIGGSYRARRHAAGVTPTTRRNQRVRWD